MLFNSFSFLIFLPIVFLLYWFVFKPLKWQNFLVVVASYIFYGWWDWRFLILIAFTSACSYISGIQIEKFDGNRKVQKWISASNIIVNLLILCIFKYYNFFVDSLDNFVASTFGSYLDWPTLKVILPVGISFYTFQALSYSIDVYRGKIRASHDVISFFAFISFFPQLVAGPIERATNLLPQFQKSRIFDYAQAVDGCRQMLWGFLKKIVIADNCAAIVNQYWEHYEILPGLQLLLLGVLFAFQIYCDFSGYSDIAIGCARLFGINLTRNFNYPYFSRSIPEFWRRWHISLMTWFRDYLYIPLGGSRCGKLKTLRNVFIVWGISGLWHGANWTFVIWGLYHAILLSVYIVFNINSKYENIASHSLMQSFKAAVQIAITFFLTIIGWIIFRADNLSQALDFLIRIFQNPAFGYIDGKKMIIWCICLLIIEWIQKNKSHPLHFSYHGLFRFTIARYAIYFVILLIMFCFVGKVQTFIYFQF